MLDADRNPAERTEHQNKLKPWDHMDAPRFQPMEFGCTVDFEFVRLSLEPAVTSVGFLK